jgi:hypothetical protein
MLAYNQEIMILFFRQLLMKFNPWEFWGEIRHRVEQTKLKKLNKKVDQYNKKNKKLIHQWVKIYWKN